VICYTDKHKIPFQIDDDDFVIISNYTWHVNSGYVKTHIRTITGQRTISLHLLLLGKAPEGKEWDHENRDRLDNRRANLRIITHLVNMQNRPKQVNNTSGVKGGRFQNGKWYVEIRVNGEILQIGEFINLEEAIVAREQAEQFYWK